MLGRLGLRCPVCACVFLRVCICVGFSNSNNCNEHHVLDSTRARPLTLSPTQTLPLLDALQHGLLVVLERASELFHFAILHDPQVLAHGAEKVLVVRHDKDAPTEVLDCLDERW